MSNNEGSASSSSKLVVDADGWFKKKDPGLREILIEQRDEQKMDDIKAKLGRRWEREKATPLLENLEDLDVTDHNEVLIKSHHKNDPEYELMRWQTFDECMLLPILKDYLLSRNYTAPTLIQQYVWPQLVHLEDLIGVAATGSGKTLGYLIPIAMDIIISKDNFKDLDIEEDKYNMDWAVKPYSCIVLPTREICVQVSEEANNIGRYVGFHASLAHGGEANKRTQIQDIEDYVPDIIVGTPGRLMSFLEELVIDLTAVQTFVLDEVDRLLDLGFEYDTRWIIELSNKNRHSMMFSATFPSHLLKLSKIVTVKDALHLQIGSSDGWSGNDRIIQETQIFLTEYWKKQRLFDMISEQINSSGSLKHDKDDPPFRALVFVNAHERASHLASFLKQWLPEGVSVGEAHRGVVQSASIDNVRDFKDGNTNVLIATDVLARGIDVPGLNWVVNFDPARSLENHFHRLGRVGRAGL